MFSPPQCEDGKCAVLLTEYPGDSNFYLYKYPIFSSQSAIMTFSCCVTKYDMSCVNNPTHSLLEMSSSANRSQLLDLIMEYNLYVKVAFLGSNLDATVNFMAFENRDHPLITYIYFSFFQPFHKIFLILDSQGISNICSDVFNSVSFDYHCNEEGFGFCRMPKRLSLSLTR